MSDFVVYLIGENISTGYVGVTRNKSRRWKIHARSVYLVGQYIRQHELKFSEDTMKTIYKGTSEECFDIETLLRPDPFMGLNMARGGHGGKTVYTEERNLKISAALSGRKNTWGHKVSETKRLLGMAKGHNNPNASIWKFTSPLGEHHIVHGNKQKFCDDNQLLASCLVYYIDRTVPPLVKSKGGFRPKSQISLQRRLNSVGWMLQVLEK